jgi:hypothetical protein
MKDSKNKPSIPGQPSGLGKYNRGPFNWLLLGLLIMMMFMTVNRWQRIEPLNYSPEFLDYVRQGQIKSVSMEQDRIVGTFNDARPPVKRMLRLISKCPIRNPIKMKN